MEHRQPIDSRKIHSMAVEYAKQGKTWHQNSEINELTVEEYVMLLGFTYIELMSGSGLLPADVKKEMLNKVNTQLQRLSNDIQQYREYYKLHIQFLKDSNQVRVDLNKAINACDDEKVLQQALLLADLSESHIANSHSFTTRYKERKQNGSKVDSGAA